MKFRNKFGQQEIAGFVLIVVLVMVGLMVFLIISVRDGPEEESGVVVENMLDVVFRTTTDCAIVSEPDYEDYEDLFKNCFRGKQCSNKGVAACDYLNDSLEDLMVGLISSDSSVEGWSVSFFEKEGGGILKWEGGNCSGVYSSAKGSIVADSTSLVVSMQICG